MRTVATLFTAHARRQATQFATGWQIIRRDGVSHYFTDHDVKKVIDGQTYKTYTGGSTSAMEFKITLSTGNFEIAGYFGNSEILEHDIHADKYRGAEVKIFLYVWSDVTIPYTKLMRGFFGEITYTGSGFQCEVLSLMQALQSNIGSLYSNDCRSPFGSMKRGVNEGCRMSLLPSAWTAAQAILADSSFVPANTAVGGPVFRVPTIPNGWQYRATTNGTTAGTEPVWPTIFDNTVNDGGILWRAEYALSRDAEVLFAGSRKEFQVGNMLGEAPLNKGGTLDGGFFQLGSAQFTSGQNEGVARDIVFFTGTDPFLVTCFTPFPFDITAADELVLTAGCDKTMEVCTANWRNWANHRGEWKLPGLDKYFELPARDAS